MNARPNIVFITTHDTGRYFGCYGIRTVRTPNIDRVAQEGVRAENFFATSPVCSPSRAAMMTGLYPQRNGLMGLVHPPFNWTFRPQVLHLSQILHPLGYDTALFYHQHEVMPDQVGRLGFDAWVAHQEGVHRPADTVAEAFAAFAGQRQGSDRPFYAQIGFGETHRRWDAGGVGPDDEHGVTVPPYLVDNEAARQEVAQLQGAVRKVDDGVGIILRALDEQGLADDTIVVFTVDHGLEFPRAKWHLYDPGIETAFLIRWPGGDVRGGRCCAPLLSNVDVTPTLLDLIGEAPPYPMDGLSFTSLLRDPGAPATRDAVFALFVGGGQHPEARCIRTRTRKLIRNFSDVRMWKTPVDVTRPARAPDDCPVTQFYDVDRDPLEFENLAGKPTEERELDDRLWRWLEDTGDPILDGPIKPQIYRASAADYQRYRERKTAPERKSE